MIEPGEIVTFIDSAHHRRSETVVWPGIVTGVVQSSGQSMFSVYKDGSTRILTFRDEGYKWHRGHSASKENRMELGVEVSFIVSSKKPHVWDGVVIVVSGNYFIVKSRASGTFYLFNVDNVFTWARGGHNSEAHEAFQAYLRLIA